MTGVALVLGAMATVLSARRAANLHRRAAMVGRVAGVLPPDARPVRSIRAWLREPPTRVVREVHELDLAIAPNRAWQCWTISIGAALVIGGYLAGPILALLFAGAAVAAPIVGAAVLRSRADGAYDATLASALDAIGRGVRSGSSLPQALAESVGSVRGSVASDIGLVAASVARGQVFVVALGDWRAARPRASVRLTVGALVLATQSGGPPARVIEDVAAAIRVRQQVEREAHALAAQARLSALVVGVAPLGFMAVMCLLDPRNAQVLFGTPLGVACVVTGVALDGLGALWMHRMSATVRA